MNKGKENVGEIKLFSRLNESLKNLLFDEKSAKSFFVSWQPYSHRNVITDTYACILLTHWTGIQQFKIAFRINYFWPRKYIILFNLRFGIHCKML